MTTLQEAVRLAGAHEQEPMMDRDDVPERSVSEALTRLEELLKSNDNALTVLVEALGPVLLATDDEKLKLKTRQPQVVPRMCDLACRIEAICKMVEHNNNELVELLDNLSI